MEEPREYSDTFTLSLDSRKSRADAKAVGSFLLAFETLVNDLQRACENNERILIKARPFADGSLEIPIDIIISSVASLFSEHPLLQKIRQVLSEYYRVKQALQGRALSLGPENSIVLDDNLIQVDPITLQCLAPRSPVSESHARAFEDIENDREIERVKVFSSTSPDPIALVERPDFASFHPESPIEIEDRDEKYEESSETLVIRQPAFDTELAWRFIWREDKISARLVAEDFLARVASGEAFSAGDSLVVTLRRPQIYSPATKTYVNRQPYIVTQVWKHIRRPTQQDLF